MPSERVQKAVEQLNSGVSVAQHEERAGVELTPDELTEVVTLLPQLTRQQWGDQLRVLIDHRRAKETTERTEAVARRADIC